MKKLFVMLAVFATLLSCTKEEQTNEVIDNTTPETEGETVGVFTASLAETKVYLGEKLGDVWPMLWSDGDVLNINGDTTVALADGDGYVGTNYAVFTMDGSGVSAPYYAAYPASAVSNWDSSKHTATITVPATQTFVEGQFNPSAYILMGKSNTPTLTLSPVMGIISLTTTAPASGTLYIKSIELESVGDEKLSGAFTTSTDYAGITGGTTSSITINAPAGTTFGTVFTFAVPAQKYESGLRFRITAVQNANGTGAEQVMVFAKQSAFEVAASTLYPLTAPAFKESVISTPTVETINSSTLGVTWSGANAANNRKKTWKIYVYSDSGCNSLVRTVDIAANLDVWTDNMGSNLRFAVGGLAQDTPYYIKVEDVQSGIVSAAGNGTTDAFTLVSKTSGSVGSPLDITSSTTGTVFAEDFSELAWGGVKYNGKDYAGCSPGPDEASAQTLTFAPYLASSPSHITNWTTLNYISPESGEWSFRNQKLNTAIPASRLSDWYSETNAVAKCGYLKLGGLKAKGYAVSPAFTIAEGYMAKVKVTVNAAKYEASTTDHSIAVVHSLIDPSAAAPSERNESNFVWVSRPDPAQYIGDVNTSGTSWEDIVVENLYLSNGDRIEFGSQAGLGKEVPNQRILVNSIKVEVVAVVPEADYLISCYERLKEFMDAVGTSSGSGAKSATGLVTHDITLTSAQQTELASSYPLAGYTGTLRGQDHTITGLQNAFFADLKGTVQDLTLNSTINKTVDDDNYEGAAILAHSLDGGTIYGCTTQGSVSFCPATAVDDGTRYVGGLVGCVLSGTIDDCSNEASVSVPHNDKTNTMIINVGGVIGAIQATVGVTLGSIENDGQVNVSVISSTSAADPKTNYVPRVGGVIGYTKGQSSLIVNGAINSGPVLFSGASYGDVFVGGVVGYSYWRINNSANYASVTCSGSLSAGDCYLGGICGKLQKDVLHSDNINGEDATVTFSGTSGTGSANVGGLYGFTTGRIKGGTNSAEVKYLGCSYSNPSVGGIVGKTDTGKTGTRIDNPTNNGKLIFSESSAHTGVDAYVGGIAGLMQSGNTQGGNNGEIVITAFTGKTLDVGGIAGCASNSAGIISGTVNNTSADISVSGVTTSEDINAGGLSGYSTGGSITGINKGDVTVKESTPANSIFVGGISGCAQNTSWSSCSNEASISNSSPAESLICVGGIVGKSICSSGTVTMSQCYNTGSISNTGKGSNTPEGQSFDCEASIGGVAGFLDGQHDLSGSSTNYNYNDGAVLEYSGTSHVAVGGVVGISTHGSTTLEYAMNKSNGDVSVKDWDNDMTYVGGILAMGYTYCTVDNTINKGDIVFTGVTSAQIWCGGIIGQWHEDETRTTTATITRCTNEGVIKTNGTDYSDIVSKGSSFSYFGGIVGGALSDHKNKTYTRCKNTGDISIYCRAICRVGGIAATCQTPPNRCEVRCNITFRRNQNEGGNTSLSHIGGIVGFKQGSGSTSYNYLLYIGTIDALIGDGYYNHYVGGIIGNTAQNTTYTFTSCSVGGSIKGRNANPTGSTASAPRLFVGSTSGSSSRKFTFPSCHIQAGTILRANSTYTMSQNSDVTNALCFHKDCVLASEGVLPTVVSSIESENMVDQP